MKGLWFAAGAVVALTLKRTLYDCTPEPLSVMPESVSLTSNPVSEVVVSRCRARSTRQRRRYSIGVTP